MQHSLQKGDQIGSYQLAEKLWKGTFGETWKASDQANEPVAVQFIQHPVMVEQMRQQPSQLPTVTTAAIAQLLAVQLSPPAFVWQYMPGRRLATFIKELGRLKLKIAVHIARKLLEILIFAGSQGMVHGGLRPTRILVNAEKNVVITNFGFGYWEQRAVSRLFKNGQAGDCKNITPYFPPEVLEDQLFDDPKSDVYGMGMLLAEMLLGQRPEKQDIASLLDKASVPKSLAAIVFKAIADFEERYCNTQQMYEELTHFVKPVRPKTMEMIYVPPPNSKPKTVTLEAIPADSEEYRVYQAQVISARQTIDAEVMAAEPAESDDGFESVDKSSKTSRLSPTPNGAGKRDMDLRPKEKETEPTPVAATTQPPGILPTARENIDAPAKSPLPASRTAAGAPTAKALVPMSPSDPTTDDEVLSRLDHEPIWPTLIGHYMAATCALLLLLSLLSVLVPRSDIGGRCPWLLSIWQGLSSMPAWGVCTAVGWMVAGAAMLALLPWLENGNNNRRKWLWSIAGIWLASFLVWVVMALRH